MELRLDRFATLYLFAPLMRLAPQNRFSIPILMYHSISDEDESHTHPYYRTTTSPKDFAVQMEYLHRNGYETCSVPEAFHRLNADTRPEVKSVAITFDDGYRDFYRNAFPVLSQFGFIATVFLPTAHIGESQLQFKGRDCLTWSEVRELQKHGMHFGSHTVSHPQLVNLGEDAIKFEIVSSKRSIEEKTGCAADTFAYPYAFPQANIEFRKMLRDSLRGAGYQNGVCTIVGRAKRSSDPFSIERLPINSFDDAALFQAKVTGGYDWVSKLQFASKALRSQTERV